MPEKFHSASPDRHAEILAKRGDPVMSPDDLKNDWKTDFPASDPLSPVVRNRTRPSGTLQERLLAMAQEARRRADELPEGVARE